MSAIDPAVHLTDPTLPVQQSILQILPYLSSSPSYRSYLTCPADHLTDPTLPVQKPSSTASTACITCPGASAVQSCTYLFSNQFYTVYPCLVSSPADRPVQPACLPDQYPVPAYSDRSASIQPQTLSYS